MRKWSESEQNVVQPELERAAFAKACAAEAASKKPLRTYSRKHGRRIGLPIGSIEGQKNKRQWRGNRPFEKGIRRGRRELATTCLKNT